MALLLISSIFKSFQTSSFIKPFEKYYHDLFYFSFNVEDTVIPVGSSSCHKTFLLISSKFRLFNFNNQRSITPRLS